MILIILAVLASTSSFFVNILFPFFAVFGEVSNGLHCGRPGGMGLACLPETAPVGGFSCWPVPTGREMRARGVRVVARSITAPPNNKPHKSVRGGESWCHGGPCQLARPDGLLQPAAKSDFNGTSRISWLMAFSAGAPDAGPVLRRGVLSPSCLAAMARAANTFSTSPADIRIYAPHRKGWTLSADFATRRKRYCRLCRRQYLCLVTVRTESSDNVTAPHSSLNSPHVCRDDLNLY